MTTVSLAPQPNFSIGYNSNLDRIYKYQQLQLRLIEYEALVIFDSRVEDLEILYAALSPKALGYTLTLEDDALVVITNLIAQTKAKRLAIVAHGTPGVLQIGALPINRQEIKKQAQLLQQWNVAEIALYSCQVGKDAEFISELAQLTKAEIFAAAGKVGAPTQGGSWQLDIQSDRGKMKPPLTANGLAKYPGVLSSPIALNLNSTSNTQLLREPSGQRSGITDGHTYKQLFAFAALKEDGSVVTWGNSTYGGDSSSVTGQLASGVTNISSTYYAFAALKEDGSVVTWGDSGFGGNSSAVSSQLTSGVTNIFSTHIAFAALKSDGSVVTWGYSTNGGDSSTVSSQLASGVTNIFSTDTAFAALKSDGSVVTWGYSTNGGDSSTVSSQLGSGVTNIFSTDSAFAALKSDGSVITWGLIDYGEANIPVSSQQLASGVTNIFSADSAFAALKKDGSVVTWGYSTNGGDSSTVSSQLGSGVTNIFSTHTAFAALKSDGSVVTWGYSPQGGDSSTVSSQLGSGVTNIFSTDSAFAALKSDGSVVTWGYNTKGGDSSTVSSQLASGVTNISSTRTAFAALKSDGSVVTWGENYYGGDSSSVSSQLTSGVTSIFSTDFGFAALKEHGSVVTWGNSEYGGDSSLVSSQLASGVINISSPFDTIGLIVAENSPTNTAIGTFSGVDPDPEDTITYSLVSGTGSTDNDSFTINGNQLLINASPDFEAKSSYSIRVRITDQTNLSYEKAFTIKITDVNETPPTPVVDIKLINSINDIFEIDASEFTKVNIKIKIKGHSSKLVNEIGVFSVDDSLGTIDGIAPDAAGYQEKALSRAKIIFSVLANNPTGFNPEDLSRILDLQGGTQLRFYLKSQGNIIFSDTTTQKITSENEGGFTLGWKDGSRGDSVFDDLQVNIQQTDEQLPIGTSLQGKSEGEALDLRNFATDSLISGTFIVNREASYNNFVGFYKVTDTDGGIDTNGDGTADILPGQAGYVQAAINERVSDIALSVGNQGTGNYNGNFQGGSIYVPFLIVDSGVNALLDSNSSNDPTVYFTFLGANADKTQHVKMLGDNIFGFEDLSGGGDKDYNDVIVKINLTHNIA
ncbi:MAG: DUF4347 domain-containing protein [Nostoc sp. DedQUE04]|uniref:DUF4347 domain-containing protein n=1 Tax=Nostoc sp. DedQUE04 TaxID=3075390 RepID=UPI002AD2BD82|nr:DUF4347 domain-containing protein [Nostoc sp. DedQUE04]MDZ8140451.1 DUF4347 domain-containing protein [Nostoc sp. DedQUE04]